jgi:spore coat polysaccharide biosynthesis protein SpsF (cytidylyltransferase family)
MKLGIIIQARLGSTRLPDKIILDFDKGESVMDIIIGKIKSRFSQYPIILATGDSPKNSKLIEFSSKHNIHFFMGSENNVLSRFIEAAELYDLTHVIRICSDNPFIDMDLLDELLSIPDKFSYDYISFKNDDGVPVIKSHFGLFAEFVSVSGLRKAMSTEGNNSHYIEHVTNYLYENPAEFGLKLIDLPKVISGRHDIRLTLDTQRDFNILSDLYTKTKNMNLDYIIGFIDENNDQYIDEMLINIKNNSK